MDRPSIERPLHESAWRRGWTDTKAAFKSWRLKLIENILRLLLALALGLATGLIISSWQGTLVGTGAGIGAMLVSALSVLGWNLYRAPIRQRNEAWGREQQTWEREKQREQLLPQVGDQLDMRVIQENDDFFLYSPGMERPLRDEGEVSQRHLLQVTNRSGETIGGYYARFREFRNPYNQNIDGLKDYELCWYDAGNEFPEKRTSIPSMSSRYVHLFTTAGYGKKADKIGIAQAVEDREYNLWYEKLDCTITPIDPTDTYRDYYIAILEVGSSSEKVSVPPVDVELKIRYHGTHLLSVEIRAEPHIDIGPPEPDRTGLS